MVGIQQTSHGRSHFDTTLKILLLIQVYYLENSVHFFQGAPTVDTSTYYPQYAPKDRRTKAKFSVVGQGCQPRWPYPPIPLPALTSRPSLPNIIRNVSMNSRLLSSHFCRNSLRLSEMSAMAFLPRSLSSSILFWIRNFFSCGGRQRRQSHVTRHDSRRVASTHVCLFIGVLGRVDCSGHSRKGTMTCSADIKMHTYATRGTITSKRQNIHQ